MNNYIPLGELIASISQTHRFNKDELVFLNTSDVLAGKILINHYTKVSELKGQAKKSIKNGDILYSEIRPKNKRYAYVKNIENIEDYIVSTKLMVLRNISKDVLDTDYLYHFLTAERTLDYLQQRAENRIGSFPQITFDVVSTLQIWLPEISIQKKIASVLSSLDTKIEINNRINVELEQLAKTLYDYWFVQFDFPNEQGKPYKSSGGKMVYSPELKREIPEGWKAGTLDDLGTIIGGSTPSKSNTKNFCYGLGIPWITPRDLSLNKGNKFITRGEFDATDVGVRDASLTIMPKGTVLLSSRAPIGYLAISRTDVTTNQGFKSFVTNKGYSTEYVFYTVKNMIPAIEKNGVGSTFKEVSGSTLKTIKISLPCKTLLKEYNSKAEPIFKRQDILETENQQLAALRDWLLPMLMNGQVTVKDAKEKVSELGLAAEPAVGYGKTVNVDFQTKECEPIERAVLAAYIVKRIGHEQIGRTKLMKLLHLTEYHCRINVNSHFVKKTAGPYDGKLIKDVEQYFQRFRLYSTEKEKKGNITEVHYLPSLEFASIDEIFREKFEDEMLRINHLLSVMKKWELKHCEVISTLYAVWNNRIINNQPVSEHLLEQDFLQWSNRKKKYDKDDIIIKSFRWMKENGVVPTGWGAEVESEESDQLLA
ncbi:hypothetical protein D1614_09490 [Maribellus luteus]|uniref:Type I restriction modification DNA specificity domain-containing protein n=1 Tax=Maribellus luteus TaxID=2305463 RepID=A0A399T4E7_9BACT|nr:restriction endonuclease subunit S [Maribellus luteus]RIJ48753.1 hypothetical protein D1614_09490 [Maribellus luteus]